MSSKILPRLRELMNLNKFTWYVLPRSDQHQSQYLAKCDERVAFASGFTGSNAIAIVSQQQALLWTDGRYFLQAQKQLYEGWTMKKMIASEKKWFEHISDHHQQGATIGVDSRLLAAETAQQRFKTLQQKGFKIIAQPKNLVDEIWQDRPGSSACEIFIHEQWAGKGIQQKTNWVRQQIKEKNGNAALFSDLSEIAWLLNLRSAQIPYNPFFKSILVIKPQDGTLYLPKGHPSQNNKEVIDHLKKANLNLGEYDPQLPQKTLVKKSSLNHYLFSLLKQPIEWQGIGLYRAVRTDKQIDGFRNCHIRDAIAQVKFWTWRSKQDKVNEYQAAEYINARRHELQHNKGLSFDTISSGGPNGAMIHYSPTETNNSDITNDMIHLVDSGGQYLDGTTDVTRAFHFGKPTEQQKDSYTRVLLGNLDIQRVKWPKTSQITGGDIDVLARRHLWAVYKDYQHGTGHGVGHFLGVHEGPVGISKYNKTVFEPNMIVTNEPGYYEAGKYGIRIENILVVKQQNEFLGFECLTLCPYDLNLIDENLLTKKDREYINHYHTRVRNTLVPLLKDDQQTIDWLTHATREI